MSQYPVADAVFDNLFFLYDKLKTRLPAPWDFVHTNLRSKERLMMNAGSYYATYFLFASWFISYVQRKYGSEEQQREKRFSLMSGCSLAMASQVLWPTFLQLTYFVFCSYYPWFTSAVVLYLQLPPFPWHLFVWALYSTIESVDSYVRITLYNYRNTDDADEDLMESDSMEDSESTEMEEDSLSSASGSDQASYMKDSLSSASGSDQASYVEDVVQRQTTKKKVRVNESSVRIKTEITDSADTDQNHDVQLTESYHSCGHTKSKKMGYCGRCFRKDNLPFKPESMEVRHHYNTRSGYAYGGVIQNMKMDQFIREFGV